MAERNTVPNLEAKATDGNPVFTPKQWLERFRQFCKREHKIDIAPLLKGEEIMDTGWTGKEQAIQEDFIWGVGPEALYQITRAEYETEPDSIKIKDLIRLFTEFYMPKRNTYHNRGDFFWAKQTEEETPEEIWRRLIEIEKECNFNTISAEELLISKYMTAITDKKLRDKIMKETKWLGHEINENGIKPNDEKVEAILKLKPPENTKDLKSFLGAIQYMAKFLPKLSEQTDRLRKLLKKNEPWIWGPEQETDFNRIKQMLTEGPCLAHYAKDKDNMVTTDASKIGLGITLWQKQDDGNIKPIAYGSRYLNDTEKNYSIGELELLAVVWGLEKFRFHLYGKKVYLYTDHQALEPLIKRNRCNKQYSARLTRWLDQLAHFDIAIQHIAGSNLKFTDYLSRNPVEGVTPEDNYDEEYVINILSEQAKLNAKYGQLFADQSDTSKRVTEIENSRSENKTEQQNNQSQASRIFENKNGVNKINRNEKSTSGQSDISASKLSCSLNHQNIIQMKNLNTEITEMDRDNFYHWGATREIMEIIRRRNKSPETRRLVDLRNNLSKPGTLRRRYDPHTQRTIFAPSRPNKRSREEIAEIDAELIQRTNRLGGGYHPLTEETGEPQNTEEGEIEPQQPETEEDSLILRGDNLPIVDLSKFNTEGKEVHYIQINHIVGKLSGNKKITEDTIKKAEFEFMMDLKTLIARTAIDPELTRVRISMRREDREATPEGYKQVFGKLSIRWGLIFMDDQIVVPVDHRRRLLDILHFGHAGLTKMTAEAKIVWWPNITRDIENKAKDCTACLASGKNLKYQLSKNHYGNLKTLTEPGQKIQIDFTGKLHNKKNKRRRTNLDSNRPLQQMAYGQNLQNRRNERSY